MGSGGEAPARRVSREAKRALILEAARVVFSEEGLEGASLRAVAARAGYAPAALYFHFASKEALYAALLQDSLLALRAAVDCAVSREAEPAARLKAASLAFFSYYAANPRELDLGFYLFRGGMKPAGLGAARDEGLNAGLEAALAPIRDAAAALGASGPEADLTMVDTFAHATGLLLLLHTGRIRMFGASAEALMARSVEERIARLTMRA